MATGKKEIYVYAHWLGMPEPKYVGILSVHQAKGRKAFGFEYDGQWLALNAPVLLDPDVSWYPGPQFPVGKECFGMFLDSMPDTWGRTLMKRRAANRAREAGVPTSNLYEVDFLLGVYDQSRMGGLRFKLDREGPFLDDNHETPTPPWSTVRELQHGAEMLEKGDDHAETGKWLDILMVPGSSLGGARPKANVLDEHGHLWIAKFPSKGDAVDKAAWEYLAYRLALNAGIEMSVSRIEKVAGKYHTFFTKRFDRIGEQRIHFASAMTMTGQNEDIIRDNRPSYLDIAEFIQFNGASVKQDLHKLWRRMVFNISISNTDDHLRNHGFLLSDAGWVLSPAYDINPSTEKAGLSLNLDTQNNTLDFGLARQVGEYFQLGSAEMDVIVGEVQVAVMGWKKLANEIGISRAEQGLMAGAFKFA
jgi:serine/threonine-protein kinase HipA